MRIADLICEVYRWRRPCQIANGSNTYSDGVLLLLRVTTDEGLTGHGWLGGTAAERPLEVLTAYVPFYRQRVVGRTPVDSAGVALDLEREHIKTFGFSGAHCQLTGALNCALWDLRGLAAGQPVHALLGGQTRGTRVRGYVAGGYYYGDDGKPEGLKRLQDELHQSVVRLHARGVKIKIGSPSVGLEADQRRVMAAREAIGPDVELMVDANCAFQDAQTAIAYARAMERSSIFWLEEPFRPDAFALYRDLARATSIPIATGENVCTVPHFRELVDQGLVHWVNADVAIMAGGYDACMETWRVASNRGCRLAPHGCQELQCHLLAAADPDGGRLEIYPPRLDPERDRIFPAPFDLGPDGRVSVPDAPGIGRVPDRAALAPYLIYTSHPATGATHVRRRRKEAT